MITYTGLASPARQMEEAFDRTDRRVKWARILWAGATDDTSRKLAQRLIADWFTPEAQQTITGMEQQWQSN